MKKLIAAGLCCLTMVASPLALSQDSATKKKPRVTANEEAAKKKAVQMKMADCTTGAKGKKMTPNTATFDRHMTDCLKN